MRVQILSMAILALPALAQAQPPAPPKADRTVDEVVVTGQAPPVQTSIDRRSYSVSGDLRAQTGSMADALRNVPSVEVDVQGEVRLRGDGAVTILIDGKPSSLFQGDNRAQALASLPADQIERVEVMTNPSAEFRADGSAGVINLITKQARGAGRTGSLRLTAGSDGRFVAGASGGYNSRNLTVSSELSARQDAQKQVVADTRLKPAATGGFDRTDQIQLSHIVANSFNGRTSLDYDLTPRLRIGAETHGGYTYFRPETFGLTTTTAAGGPAEAFERQTNIHQRRANLEVAANLRRKLSGDGELTLSLSHEETIDARVRAGRTSDPTPPDAFDEQRLDNHLRTTELKGDLTRPLAEAARLKLGFDLEQVDNSYRNRGFKDGAPDAALTNLFGFRRTVGAAYGSYERPIGELTVLAGLRVEAVALRLDQAALNQTVETDELGLYPSLHLGWKLSDGRQLTASYSRRVQRPDPGDYNAFRLMLDPLNYRAGDPGQKPQQTQSFELGYEHRQGPSVLLATAYYRENRDGVADVLRDLGGGVFLSQRANVARSASAGLELVANGKLPGALSYSFTLTGAWTRLDSIGFAPTRDATSLSGRGNLSWQATPDDLVQLNLFVNGERLTPQGRTEPTGGLDLGYRHKISDRLAFVATAQDVAGTFRISQVNDTPALRERSRVNLDTRQLRVGLIWTFGGGRSRDPGFEFQNGGGPAQ